MVKVKQLKRTQKTYCKKKFVRKKNIQPIFINSITVTNVFQITNNFQYVSKSSPVDGSKKFSKESTYHSETSSKSEDEFDRLLKGPTYNKSSTSRSIDYRSNEQFIKIQERSSFCHSNEASSSVHLFKDSNASELYSMSHIPTPPSYRIHKKKLVKVVSSPKVKIFQTYRGKKYKRLNNSSHLKKCSTATSSTPTRPQLVLAEGWMEPNLSPILPSGMLNPLQNVLTIRANKEAKTEVPFDISALTAGFGKLGIGNHSKQTQQVKEDHKEERKRNGNERNFELEYSPKESNTSKISEVEHRVCDNKEIKNDGLDNKSCDSLVKNEDAESPKIGTIQEVGNSISSHQDVSTENENCIILEKTEEENSQKEKKNRCFPETEQDNSMVEPTFSLHQRVPESSNQNKNDDKDNKNQLEPGVDISMIKPRLSLRPGKQWKRSFLQQKLEENRKYSFCSYIPNQRRSTIGPALLGKLLRAAPQDISAPSLSRVVNESLEVTLPILKLNPDDLKTVTKRKKRKIFHPLDIVEEEEQLEHIFSFNQSNINKEYSCRQSLLMFEDEEDEDASFNKENEEEGKRLENIFSFEKANGKKESSCRQSLLMFEDEENGDASFNDEDFLFSGVDNLSSVNVDMPNCLISQGEVALATSTAEEFLKDNIKLGALARCGQEYPLPFSEIFPDNILDNCKKIGEGVFGEVFMLRRSKCEMSVLKVIPVEGTQLVNNEPQKHLDEVLSEIIISEELSLLRNYPDNCTSGFCELKDKFCLQGAYPLKLVELWKKFAEESETENDCPDMFDSHQLYIVLELENAGQPVESFKFDTAKQALSVFLQTTFTLGAAELSLEFEHRDLHIGNVLIKESSEQYINFIHNGYSFQLPTYGIKATIIDFTLSRISFEEDVLFFDLEKDPELFTAEGDYQFEIYRLMRDDLENNWRTYAPITNIRWLHYLADKLITNKKYRRNKSIVHKRCMKTLMKLRDIVLDFSSSSDLSEYLLESYEEISDIIKFC